MCGPLEPQGRFSPAAGLAQGNWLRLVGGLYCRQRQAPFADSDRQIRGLILKALLGSPALSVEGLVKTVGKNPARTTGLIHTLIKEGFLEQEGAHLRIASSVEAPGSDAGNP